MYKIPFLSLYWLLTEKDLFRFKLKQQKDLLLIMFMNLSQSSKPIYEIEAFIRTQNKLD